MEDSILHAAGATALQELDLKIGCIFTRLMTRQYLRYAVDKFRLRDQTCLSYGPCQTPTLWFCQRPSTGELLFNKVC